MRVLASTKEHLESFVRFPVFLFANCTDGTTTLRLYEASCGRPHKTRSIGEVVSSEVLTKEDLQMFYVYLIKSISHPEQKYIGQTDDLKRRLEQHNAGYSIHTAKYKPWELVNYFAFSSKDAALEFEQYLKTGSGHAFAKRHFWK